MFRNIRAPLYGGGSQGNVDARNEYFNSISQLSFRILQKRPWDSLKVVIKLMLVGALVFLLGRILLIEMPIKLDY